MIRWKEIDDALGAVVSAALKAANLPAVRERKDVNGDLWCGAVTALDLGQTDGMGTDDYAETGCDIEIILSRDGTRPRDELNTAADAIRAALRRA